MTRLAVIRRMARPATLAIALLAAAASARAQPPTARSPEVEAERRELLARAFGPLTQLFVEVVFVGSAESLGLTRDSVAGQTRGRLEEALPHMIVLPGGIESDEVSMRDTGQVTLRVWTVGEDNPIAYLVEINAGLIEAGPLAFRIYESQVLGYSGRHRFPADLDRVIEGLVRDFATTFMDVRGEL